MLACTTAGVTHLAGLQTDDLPRVVVISIDGLKPENYTKPGGTEVPTLRALAAQGAYARGVVGVFPTVTYPSHTTMITGLPPAAHGIYNNRILDPADRSNAAWYWYARDIAAPTLTGAVQGRGLRVATVYWPVTVGADVDFLVPEFARSTHRESLTLLRALSKPATLLDDVEAARREPFPYPLNDAARTDIAAWIIRAHRPHLLLLHIFESDDAQHVHGPASPEAVDAIAGADRNVARILAALDEAGLRARTNIVVLSDHGFLPLGRQLQLNALFKQEKLLDVDVQGRISRWDARTSSPRADRASSSLPIRRTRRSRSGCARCSTPAPQIPPTASHASSRATNCGQWERIRGRASRWTCATGSTPPPRTIAWSRRPRRKAVTDSSRRGPSSTPR